MFTRDYILRMIEQLKRALATILQQRQEQEFEDALDTVGDTCDDLLGHQAHFLRALDPPSAARILGKWLRIKIYAALLKAEAEVLDDRAEPGDAAQAAAGRQRALELLLLGLDYDGRGDPELKDRARELLPQVSPTQLPPRAQTRLRELKLWDPR